MADRFHFYVFNTDRIALFLTSFWRVRGFDPFRDRLIVLDSSADHLGERARMATFADAHGWRLGKEVVFERRPNWGLAEGGRIDLFERLTRASEPPAFVWHVQDHFLDIESPFSRYEAGMRDDDRRDIAGCIKDDTISDDTVIDLDTCERIFAQQPRVGVLHASRMLGMAEADSVIWYFADGGNSCIRSDLARAAYPVRLLEGYRAIFDGSYEWALFMELEWGRLLCETRCNWYHIGDGTSLAPPASGTIPPARNRLGRVATHVYDPIYREYSGRLHRALQLPRPARVFLAWSRPGYRAARSWAHRKFRSS